MAEEVWGIGYGRKRHLVQPGSEMMAHGPLGSRVNAQARCDYTVWVHTFSDSDNPKARERVMRKDPCLKCVKKVEAST